MTAAARPSLRARLGRFAVLQGARRRAIAALSLVSVGDFFVPALPSQSSVLALALMQPQRAWLIIMTFALAAVTGAGILVGLLHFAVPWAEQFDAAHQGDNWGVMVEFVRQYGVYAVFVASMLPPPPRLLTAAAILSGAPASAVLVAVFCGKLIWFACFVTLIVRAPQWLAQLPIVGEHIRQFQAYRMRLLAQQQAEQQP